MLDKFALTLLKHQQEILPKFEIGLKKAFFHRRLRSNNTHLAQHLENLPGWKFHQPILTIDDQILIFGPKKCQILPPKKVPNL